MKIVFLLQASSSVLKGGAEIQADIIIREILRHGQDHEIHYVSDLIRKESGPRLEKVQYVFLKSYGTKYSFLNAVPLVRILRELDPDVIYQRWRTPYTGIAAWYAARAGKSLIFELASDKDSLKSRTPLTRTFLPNWISEHLGRYGMRRASVIVCQSRGQQNALKRLYGLGSLLIPKGHPVPQGPFIKPEVPVVVWVANIKPLKQPEIFLGLARALEGLRARFVIVGRPDVGQYQERVERMAAALPNVTYAGELSHEKTNETIASASVLVNTSLYEGTPNTFIQAWMRETPVVSLNVDPDDVLSKEGIGFRSGTFERLVEDVRFLIEHDAERAARAKAARAYAVARHDIERVGDTYMGLFERMSRGRPDHPVVSPLDPT